MLLSLIDMKKNKEKNKGLDILYESGRTIFADQQEIKNLFVLNASKNIGLFVLVISFFTKLEYIGFCHTKSENFDNNKFFPMLLHPTQKLMLIKVMATDKNRYGIL